jgi:hypothetical protein
VSNIGVALPCETNACPELPGPVPTTTPDPPDTSVSNCVMFVHWNGDVPLPWTKSPAAHDVKPVSPFATELLVVHVTLPLVGEQDVEPAPATVRVPVLVQLTGPVVGKQLTPLNPVTLVTADAGGAWKVGSTEVHVRI